MTTEKRAGDEFSPDEALGANHFDRVIKITDGSQDSVLFGLEKLRFDNRTLRLVVWPSFSDPKVSTLGCGIHVTGDDLKEFLVWLQEEVSKLENT